MPPRLNFQPVLELVLANPHARLVTWQDDAARLDERDLMIAPAACDGSRSVALVAEVRLSAAAYLALQLRDTHGAVYREERRYVSEGA